MDSASDEEAPLDGKTVRERRRRKIDEAETNPDKGRQGEKAAYKLFQRMGFTRLKSKLPGNRGIDHVFVKYDEKGEPQEIYLVESKFSAAGKLRLSKTNDGVQQYEEWIYAKLKEMRDSGNPQLKKTAKLVLDSVSKGIVKVAANVLNPQGINRWNQFETYTLGPRGSDE